MIDKKIYCAKYEYKKLNKKGGNVRMLCIKVSDPVQFEVKIDDKKLNGCAMELKLHNYSKAEKKSAKRMATSLLDRKIVPTQQGILLRAKE